MNHVVKALEHFVLHWGEAPPAREWDRRETTTSIEIKHDYGSVRQTLEAAELRPSPAADRAILIAIPTAQALIAVVVIDAADHRANRHELVERRRNPGEGFTDLDAGDFRADRLELASDLFRSVGFYFPHVLVRRTATKKDVDDRLVSIGSLAAVAGTAAFPAVGVVVVAAAATPDPAKSVMPVPGRLAVVAVVPHGLSLLP